MKNNNFAPFGSIIYKVYLDALVDDYLGLAMYFTSEEGDNIKVSFETYISYRNCDESERFLFIGENFFHNNNHFYKSETTDYIDWIIKESQDIRKDDKIVHYIFITPNDIVEVLSLEEPKIEKFDINQKIIVNIK